MKISHSLLALFLTLGAAASTLSFAQEAASPAASAPAAQPWKHKTRQLDRAQVDALLAEPKKLLIIDLRRPDELTKHGSFLAYLNVQLKDLPQALDYIPKGRTILTVSNRAHRAGDAGDILLAHGYKVAGAIGTDDYREAGGTIIVVSPPAPKASQ